MNRAGHQFAIGDRVRIVKASEAPELVGVVTTITAAKLDPKHGLVYELDLPTGSPPPFTPRWWAPPRVLVPVYDGDAAAKWADCVWRPSGVAA